MVLVKVLYTKWKHFILHKKVLIYSLFSNFIDKNLNYCIDSHEAMMEMLDKFGPLSVALDASNRNFDYYSSGIFATRTGSCSNKESSLGIY